MFKNLVPKLLQLKYYLIFREFKKFTMIPALTYIQNLRLVNEYRHLDGCVVECGTWRGGMIGGIAKLLRNREYYLYDSFEGLPEAKEIDGTAAIAWQNDKDSPGYFNNCKAEMDFAEKAMVVSGAQKYFINKGWFSETLPHFDKNRKIAILRLDGDWYDSTMDCLTNLYDNVIPGGIIIMDDYYAWDGCARAVHDFLSKRNLPDRIMQWNDCICYIKKA
jgi:O-methyltransferase